MKPILFAVLCATPLAAMAQSPAAAETPSAAPVVTTAVAAPVSIRSGAVIYSADGRVVGRVDHVAQAAGVPTSASVIYNGNFVNIPVASLTQNGRRYVTSMTMAQLQGR